MYEEYKKYLFNLYMNRYDSYLSTTSKTKYISTTEYQNYLLERIEELGERVVTTEKDVYEKANGMSYEDFIIFKRSENLEVILHD
tara:strand:- start:75617 stop:75871 length:255 start_codon:yes stop_codon:yes gene_type:complete